MTDFVNGLKSLSGSLVLTPEQSDFLHDAAEEMNRLSRVDAQSVGMREALLKAQKIIERDFPNGQLAIDIRNVLAADPPATPITTEVQDTWLVGGPPDLKAMSGSVESDRVIQLHFRRRVTDDDRKWLLDAINLKLRSDKEASEVPEGDRARPAAFLAWAVEMFGPVAKVRGERLMRFVEEAIELAHAEGMASGTLELIVNRVYSRPPGETLKEIGQAQATLEMFAENIGESSESLAQKEWERVQGIPQEEWQRRHSAKQAIGIAHPSQPSSTERA